MNEQLAALADELEQEQATLQRELDEIELLLRQTATEAERHDQRRTQAEERVTALERNATADGEARAEAYAQLINQTRRATLMQSQMDVLTGKQRALQRFRERLAAAIPIVREAAGSAAAGGSAVGVPGSAPATTVEAGAAKSGDILAAQEHMRREIARQMHDGPAQSIANIALQAQIVERLYERDPERAKSELSELVGMVQQALDATKNFIFDVRPMVLDDLGLVPTLRRSASERSRRSGVTVRFDSIGPDRRLGSDLESALFRIVDDAVGGFVELDAEEVGVRLEWSDEGLRTVVRGRPAGGEDTPEAIAKRAVAAARRDRELPAALATMIHEQERREAAQRAGLPPAVVGEIIQRGSAFGIRVDVSADRWTVEARVSGRS